MQIGYMRVSTDEQNPDAQRDALLRASVAEENLYVDRTSGAKSSRPQWDLVCRVLRPGDVLVATRLDRVGRSRGLGKSREGLNGTAGQQADSACSGCWSGADPDAVTSIDTR